ncbi:MAG: amidohydrolase [Bacteroidetes bacterium]|nr:amidohydrolase [Bacteroidota bacterium]
MTIQQGRIDVHHHLIPPNFSNVMHRKGIHFVAGAPLPNWTLNNSLEVMNDNGIQTAIMSLSCPGVYFGNVQEAVDLARSCNEFAAEAKVEHPNRFGFFAVLPMPFTDKACIEATYALDVLKADGIVLMGSTEGQFLGDPNFDELMAELNRRKTIVFVHPNMHATSETLSIKTPGFMVEFLCDTTRAAVNLVLTGAIEKYPNIKWILAHAGGFLPYVAWRISLGNLMKEIAINAPQGILTYIKSFYFDTALSPSRMSMAALKELVEPSHILFGSDFPFAPAPLTASQVSTLDNSTFWDEPTKYGINRGHALSLFPQYKMDNEQIVSQPIFKEMGFKEKMKFQIKKPILGILERIRNK